MKSNGLRINESHIRSLVEDLAIAKAAEQGEYYVPVASSNRHCHLSREHIRALFGEGYRLEAMRTLRQPGQYACAETVKLVTKKGALQLRVVGPERDETQAEISVTDAFALGIRPVVRMSGDLEGSGQGMLVAANGNAVELTRGVIVSARHLHLSQSQAELFNLRNGDHVRAFAPGLRAIVFENIAVRCGNAHLRELHLDIDEVNAAMLKSGALLRIEKQR